MAAAGEPWSAASGHQPLANPSTGTTDGYKMAPGAEGGASGEGEKEGDGQTCQEQITQAE